MLAHSEKKTEAWTSLHFILIIVITAMTNILSVYHVKLEEINTKFRAKINDWQFEVISEIQQARKGFFKLII